MTTVLADWGYISTEDQTENWFADFRIATLWICWQSCVKTL